MGNVDAALALAHDLHQEELFHTAWRGVARRDWWAAGGHASGKGNIEYGDQRISDVADNIVDSVTKLPAAEQAGAIDDLAGVLRLYSPDSVAEKDFWNSLKTNPETRHDVVVEGIRQLAHFGMEGRNTETEYMKYLDPNRYVERSKFFARMVNEVQAGKFGGRLRDEINATKAAVLNPGGLRQSPDSNGPNP